MQYLILERFMGVIQNQIGPFPSQCQAYSYSEYLAKDCVRGVEFIVLPLREPAFMPEQIHG